MTRVTTETDELLTIDQACARFGLDAAELGRLIDAGSIRVERVGDRLRVRAADLRAMHR